jgi:hypothetical protein
MTLNKMTLNKMTLNKMTLSIEIIKSDPQHNYIDLLRHPLLSVGMTSIVKISSTSLG